jgi:hypothetical protein
MQGEDDRMAMERARVGQTVVAAGGPVRFMHVYGAAEKAAMEEGFESDVSTDSRSSNSSRDDSDKPADDVAFPRGKHEKWTLAQEKRLNELVSLYKSEWNKITEGMQNFIADTLKMKLEEAQKVMTKTIIMAKWNRMAKKKEKEILKKREREKAGDEAAPSADGAPAPKRARGDSADSEALILLKKIAQSCDESKAREEQLLSVIKDMAASLKSIADKVGVAAPSRM